MSLKPIIKNSLGIFYPAGFLDSDSLTNAIEPQDLAFLKTKCEAVLVSFRKVVFFNKRGMNGVVKLLLTLEKKTSKSIGICDYDSKKYNMILEMFNHNLPFSLFESEKIAELFYSRNIKDKETKKILVFNKDVNQKNQIALALVEKGYKPTIAKDLAHINSIRNDYEMIITSSNVATKEKMTSVSITQNVIIYSLSGYLDSNLSDSFDSVYHQNCLKVGFKFFLFDATKVSSINIHGVNFLSKLSTYAAEYGASIAICGLSSNTPRNLLEDIEDAGILIYETKEKFFDDDSTLQGGAGMIKSKHRHITKALVGKLALMVQICNQTVESMTKQKITMKDSKIQTLSLDKNADLIGAAVAFYGDIDGMFLLVFEKEIAKKACAILLDETSDNSELVEALGEFIIIIAERIAYQLAKQKIQVEITMPRTFDDIDEIIENYKDDKGAQVNMQILQKPMALFLTK